MAVSFGESEELRIGVLGFVAIGNPFGLGGSSFPPVSSRRRGRAISDTGPYDNLHPDRMPPSIAAIPAAPLFKHEWRVGGGHQHRHPVADGWFRGDPLLDPDLAGRADHHAILREFGETRARLARRAHPECRRDQGRKRSGLERRARRPRAGVDPGRAGQWTPASRPVSDRCVSW